ncbi:hypothetical protein [Massilia genomosp. 1]|uniref:TonB C-terminal domain-containing protein n=1 Tax=Massilia genomosp. 1 TaxID=2609280 RepID=A0ABX0N0G3_9BURK|nr:hypothetical protein [Massilia genomosp. 1]NHZ65570.1 hypothetical protein [Massilia genomosp. 1]
MPKHLIKISMLCAAVLMAGCETTGSKQADPNAVEAPSPKNPDFAGEMAKFDAQFPNAKATKYENESIAFNNDRKLDQKGDCHGKSKYPVTIVLILDADGKVTKTMTDVENAKAACFRSAYNGVQFPRPPMAPYRKAILLK